MQRVLCVYLPFWDIERMERRWGSRDSAAFSVAPPFQAVSTPGGSPVLRAAPRLATLLTDVGPRNLQRVVRCCARAAEAGAVPGMPLAEAKALLPEARCAAFDAGQSRSALRGLGEWCARFSPRVMVDPVPSPGLFQTDEEGTRDGLLMDITGTGHLFGGEALMLYDLATRLGRLGFTCRLAAAPTIGAAWAMARYGTHAMAMVNEEQISNALAPLPVTALRVEDKVRQELLLVGIERVRELSAIGRESLRARFGAGLLLRMDQALGRVAEEIPPAKKAEDLTVCRRFEGATVQLEAILQTARELLEELCDKLRRREAGVRHLMAECTRENAEPVAVSVMLGRPMRRAGHLWSLLRARLENVNMGDGVEAMTLKPVWVARMRHEQMGMEAGRGGEMRATAESFDLLDTLTNRLGEQRVLRAVPLASHVPERAITLMPAVVVPTPSSASRPQPRTRMQQASRQIEEPRLTELRAAILRHRPALLLDPPEEVDALAIVPDHAPRWIRWRGREHALVKTAPAERISEEWWNKPFGSQALACTVRDYFRVQTAAGQWLWLFREMPPLGRKRWFVHGIWT